MERLNKQMKDFNKDFYKNKNSEAPAAPAAPATPQAAPAPAAPQAPQ